MACVLIMLQKYQETHTRLKVHPALQFASDETMTMLFSLNNKTYAEKGAKSPFLATAGDEMDGWTDHFWMTPGTCLRAWLLGCLAARLLPACPPAHPPICVASCLAAWLLLS